MHAGKRSESRACILCMCVRCTYVRMFTCMYVYLYINMYLYMDVCTYVCISCVCMSVCLYVCLYVCTYVCIYLCIYVCMHVYICTHEVGQMCGTYILKPTHSFRVAQETANRLQHAGLFPQIRPVICGFFLQTRPVIRSSFAEKYESPSSCRSFPANEPQ